MDCILEHKFYLICLLLSYLIIVGTLLVIMNLFTDIDQSFNALQKIYQYIIIGGVLTWASFFGMHIMCAYSEELDGINCFNYLKLIKITWHAKKQIFLAYIFVALVLLVEAIIHIISSYIPIEFISNFISSTLDLIGWLVIYNISAQVYRYGLEKLKPSRK